MQDRNNPDTNQSEANKHAAHRATAKKNGCRNADSRFTITG